MRLRGSLFVAAIVVGVALPFVGCEGDDIELSPLDAATRESIDATLDVSADTDVAAEGGAVEAGPVRRIFPSSPGASSFSGCIFGSPQLYGAPGSERIIVVSNDGTVGAISPDDGTVAWQIQIPVETGESIYALATPAIVGDTLFEAFSTISSATGQRDSARVVAIDLAHHAVDESFPEIMLAASQLGAGDAGIVNFLPSNAIDRSPVVFVQPDAAKRGLLYVSFANLRDIQPWHGWMFEIDLDQWHDQGAAQAVTGTLLTTPENNCPVAGQGGSREQLCGGGIWAPAGIDATVTDAGLEILVVSGNGQLDLNRHDYANTMMRVRPGLTFDPACDASSCMSDGGEGGPPDVSCMQSCDDLFVPHVPDGGPVAPRDPECVGLDFWDCYAAQDWDLGADGPTRITLKNGLEIVLLPAKDGGIYLVDAHHLGTLYDRMQLAEACGSNVGDPCTADWAGMMVTKAEVIWDGTDPSPIVVVPTFEFDHTHPAGVVGLRIVTSTDGTPHFERAWQAPLPTDSAAQAAFRRQPTLARIEDNATEGAIVWIVDITSSLAGGHGLLFQIRASDGAILSETPLAGNGQRYARPLFFDHRVYAVSCGSDNGPGQLEGYSVTP